MDKSVDKAANYQKLKAFALELGFDLFGIADVTELSGDFLLEAKTRGRFGLAISLGKRLNDAVLEDIDDHPTPLYFHHYRQTNAFLDRGALLLADHVQKMGFAALPIAASQIIDWEKQRAHLSHKHVGRAAGLGWFGRNNLLVNPDLGARFRLVTVLTDMPLEPAKPPADGCGTCRACVATCPAGAIKERREDFDHLACFEKLKEFQKKRLVSQFICGVCVKACRGPAKGRPR
jgi:NAD-dependent dihydropyrimidine dehydrogenase PreA subunit